MSSGRTKYLEMKARNSGFGSFFKTGAYVSGTSKNAGIPKKRVMMPVIHAVHRHPRSSVMYTPATGPTVGPIKVVVEYIAEAVPLAATPQKSA